MSAFYWAVRPKSQGGANTRIEKAETARRACDLAFGRGTYSGMEAKNLGTLVRVIQSDAKRIAMLKDPKGWEMIR